MTITKSESVKELAAALAKAQGSMHPAKMDSTNPFLKNKYADLGSVIQAAQASLTANGLSYSQHPALADNQLTITTLLMHASGEWIESELTLGVSEVKGLSAAQAMGSVITYLRRYSLAAILGVYADEDTDGNDKKTEAKQQRQPTPPPADPAGHPTPPAEPAKIVYPQKILLAIVAAGYAANEFEARGMLAHSVLPADVREGIAKGWAHHYYDARHRDPEPATADQAGNEANDAYLNSFNPPATPAV